MGFRFWFQTSGRLQRKGQNSPPAKKGHGEQATYQTTNERIYGLGQGRAKEDPESLPGYAQLQHIKNPRRPLESHVQLRETTVLRRTIEAVEAPHGKAPGLSIPPPPEKDLHCRREEDEDIRVQVLDEAAQAGDAAAVV